MDDKKNSKIINFTRKNPQSAAYISKTVGNDKVLNIASVKSSIPNITEQIRTKLKNNNDIMNLFPDVELAERCLVSSILSPNDMQSTKLTYKSPEIRLPSNIKQVLVTTIKDYIDGTYDIQENLYLKLKDALFIKGAYIEAIIPEASLDDIISRNDNSLSVENFTSTVISGLNKNNEIHNFNIPYGENKKVLELELTFEDMNLCFTDDIRYLAINDNFNKYREENNYKKSIKNIVNMDNESDLDVIFRDPKNYKLEDLVKVNTVDDASRKSLTKPLITRLPVESVVPIYITGDPSNHVGYFVLLDENGVPVSSMVRGDREKLNSEVYSNYSPSFSNSFNLIDKAKNALNAFTDGDKRLDNLDELYGNIVEDMLKKRLSKYGLESIAEISDASDLYRVMFQRALSAKQTRILYLPKELVSFLAFEYRDNGTGKSLLEKSSVLFSLRAILMFGRIMAQLKNSINNTVVSAKLDDDDPDPQATMEDIISNAMKTRQSFFPFGVMNVNDLSQWAQMIGFMFKFEGKGLPNMTIDVTDTKSDKAVPDDALDEEIRKMIYMSFGLNPQMMDATMQADFATTIVSNNLLFAKYVKQLQKVVNKYLEEHVKKIFINDPILQSKFRDVITSNFSTIKDNIKTELKMTDEDIDKKITLDNICKYITKKYIFEMKIYLPEPDTNEADSLGKAFETYKNNVNNYLEEIITQNSLPQEYIGNLSNELDKIKSLIKTMLLKKWAEENNYIPDLSEMLTLDIDDKPILNISDNIENYLNNIKEGILPMYKVFNKFKKDLDKKLDKYEIGGDGMGGGSDLGGDSGDTGDSDGGDSDGGSGGDEFGDLDNTGTMDDDTGTEDGADNNPDTNDDNSDQNKDGSGDDNTNKDTPDNNDDKKDNNEPNGEENK